MESPKSYLNSLKSLVFRQILRKLSEFRWNNVYLAFFVKFLHLDIQETKVINLILSLEECTVTTDFKRSQGIKVYQAARNVCKQRQITPACEPVTVSWRNGKFKWKFLAPAASQRTLHCVLNCYSTVVALSSVKVRSRSSLASVTKNPVSYDIYILCIYIVSLFTTSRSDLVEEVSGFC